MQRRHFVTRVMALGASTALMNRARAQTYPSKPITLVVPYAPGGSTDTLARAIAEKLQVQLGQAVIVDNKPGATTRTATDFVRQAAPDGHTLYLLTSQVGRMPLMSPSTARYDSFTDLTYIGRATRAVVVLVANTGLPFASLKDMLVHAKSRPGKLTFATTGMGSSDHLAGELLGHLTDTSYHFRHYRGGAPAVQDVMAGVADLRSDALASSKPHIDSGRLKLLAVWTERRLPDLPHVPTVSEIVPGASFFGGYYGLGGPKGMPKPIVDRLNKELGKIMQLPDVAARMTALGMAPDTGTPEYFTQVVRSDYNTWAKLIKDADLKLEP